MTHPDYLRAKAREMRLERNLTIDELAERLALSRSTIHSWVRDLPIERSADRQSAGQRKRSARNVERCRRIRIAAYERGRAEFSDLAQDPTFRDFVCMYIGEGYKRNRNRVALGNSDPIVVSLAARWISAFAANKMDYYLQFHADQDPEWLSCFWAFRLGARPGDIRLQRKSNSNQLAKRTWRSKYGVLSVGSNDTGLRARLQGWIDEAKLDWSAGLNSRRFGA